MIWERFERQRSDWANHALTIPPALTIESVSHGYEAHDRVTKRAWYAEFGVPNYWIIDGVGRTLECLRLNGDHYDADAAGRRHDIVAPTSFPGLQIRLKQVWEE
jgi:Uma2 family endonuclease